MAMAAFEELDYGMTPLGELILRRREVLSLDRAEVFEVKLAGVLLMSSIVNQAEIALAELALPLVAGDACDVLVGGLGLGYTAKAALEVDNVASVTVVEYLQRVITWHRGGLVPLGPSLTQDTRCQLIHGDFFAAVGSPARHDDDGSTPCSDAISEISSTRFHAILLDIDHSPQLLLHAGHGEFYTSEGLERLTSHIHPGGVFALWSADPPEESLTDALSGAFANVRVRDVAFYNPLLDLQEVNYIVIAQLSPGCH
jgi:hypothetical protein